MRAPPTQRAALRTPRCGTRSATPAPAVQRDTAAAAISIRRGVVQHVFLLVIAALATCRLYTSERSRGSPVV